MASHQNNPIKWHKILDVLRNKNLVYATPYIYSVFKFEKHDKIVISQWVY